MKNKVIKIVSVFFIFTLLYLVNNFIWYWNLFNRCQYTDKELNIPDLKNLKLIYWSWLLVWDSDENAWYDCNKSFKDVSKYILNPDGLVMDFSNYKPIPENSIFFIYKIVSIEKHWITTIDSWWWPSVFFLLKDLHWEIYAIPKVFLNNINNKQKYYFTTDFGSWIVTPVYYEYPNILKIWDKVLQIK